MNRLKVNQPCPLHRNSRTCSCHPEPVVKFQRERKIQSFGGIKKMPDGREVCSPAIRRQRKDRMMELGLNCIACHKPFASYSDAELGHRNSKGMNGHKTDDSWGNIGLIHAWTNRDQGSMSLDDYLKKLAEKGVKPCQQS